jgi:hypothetical protein
MSDQLPFAVEMALRSLDVHRWDYSVLPLLDSLEAYRDHGVGVGGFLTALLSNDLSAACGQADSTNLWLLPIYSAFLFNEMPSPSHGSRERVEEWLARHRAQREQGVTP